MPDSRDQLDISSRPATDRLPGDDPDGSGSTGTSGWLGLYFKCAGAYTRAYKNSAGTGYRGRCPRCGKSMDFRIGAGGTSRRNFEVSC